MPATEAMVNGHETPVGEVEVTYNGVTKPLEVNLQAAVQAALEQALNLFNITNNRHLMALFTASGAELTDNRSLGDLGVKTQDLLVLRASTVRGG